VTKPIRQEGSEAEHRVRRNLVQVAVFALLDAPRSAPELVDGLRERGAEIDEVTLRAVLRRMERLGWVREESDGGRRKGALYVLTAEGTEERARSLAGWRQMCKRLAVLAGGMEEEEGSPFEAERAALAAERQELERQRSDLLSTVSHELRTPLTLIRTSIGLLLDSNPEPVMRERLLRNIKQSADRMHVLVADLLDLVRLRSGRADLQLRYVDVGELVTGAAALMRPLLDEKQQELELQVPSPAPVVMCDHRRLEQVLLNLLSNANKFAPAGAHVRISLSEREQVVTIAVADNGPGIPPEAQARLFEQFYTTRTSSPSHNIGAGLGLPIAKGIVEAHGGRIWVQSAVGEGSTFYVTVPREGPTPGGPQ
jgi:signal transduction histidine kinase